MLMKYDYDYQAFVSGDGSYGVDTVVTFNYDEFHERYPNVWSNLDEVHDSTRIELIMATLEQDEEAIRDLCDENDLNPLDFLD